MSSRLTTEAAIAHVRTMLSIGASTEQLVEWAGQQFPADDQPDVAAIELEARARMLAAAGEGLDVPAERLSWSSVCRHQRLADLYSRCLHTQDYKACLAVEKEQTVAKAEREREAKAAARSDRRAR